ncbi:unnamed protein product [Lymnaea stagnalis]|uniref:Uncharacterized protein n=1 Tax=Lymnaea stagnalis TaxID=6523 RepID=A0AAV2IQW7_LYMST
MSIVIINTRSPGEGETIAEVTPYNPPAAEGTYVGKVQVNGSVLQTQANGEFGFLSLIWTAPLDDLVGTYTCEANALTHSGRLVTLTGSLGIQARQPEVEDLVPFIIGFDNRIAQLEQENQELKHRLDLLKV